MDGLKGEWKIVLGLVLLVGFLFGVSFFVSSAITGKTVSEFSFPQENYLGEPFELRAWVVNEGGVKLDVKNSGNENYLIKKFEISNCGSFPAEFILNVGESRVISVSCKLEKNSFFEGVILVSYSAVGNGSLLTAQGKVKDVV